jgi:hypothetical protein
MPSKQRTVRLGHTNDQFHPGPGLVVTNEGTFDDKGKVVKFTEAQIDELVELGRTNGVPLVPVEETEADQNPKE